MTLSRDEGTIREKAIRSIHFQLYRKDRHGVVSRLHLSDISTLVLDYFVDNTAKTTINGRINQNVKNTQNVSISELGEIKWTLQTADTTCNDTGLADGKTEKHIAMFQWVCTDGLSDSERIELFIVRDSKA